MDFLGSLLANPIIIEDNAEPEFTPIPKLSLEFKRMIWKYVGPEPRVVKISYTEEARDDVDSDREENLEKVAYGDNALSPCAFPEGKSDYTAR
jgi:hypothetical protein